MGLLVPGDVVWDAEGNISDLEKICTDLKREYCYNINNGRR